MNQKKFRRFHQSISQNLSKNEHDSWLKMIDIQLEDNQMNDAMHFPPYLTQKPTVEQKFKWKRYIEVAKKVVNQKIQENQQLDREKYTEERDEDESDYDSVSSQELYGGAVNNCPRQYAESEVNLFLMPY